MAFDAKHKKAVASDTKLATTMVRERRLELPRRLTHAPQTCLSTCSSTLANCFFSKARVIITEKTRMSRTNFKISCLSDIHNCIGYAQQQRGKHQLAADARLNKVIAVEIRIVAMQRGKLR